MSTSIFGFLSFEEKPAIKQEKKKKKALPMKIGVLLFREKKPCMMGRQKCNAKDDFIL